MKEKMYHSVRIDKNELTDALLLKREMIVNLKIFSKINLWSLVFIALTDFYLMKRIRY